MSTASGTIVAPVSFNTTADAIPGFEPVGWTLKATVGTVDVSYDGVNVAVTLTTTDSILVFPVRNAKLWVRQNGGAATLRWSAFTVQ